MAQGVVDHATVDDPATSRAQMLRAVDVRSERLGPVGRCDTIEVTDDGMVIVEHKAAPVRRKAETTLPQRVQLALQALCLREHGHAVLGAAVWFSTVRRRVSVVLDDKLLAESERQALATRAAVDGGPPEVLEDDPRCGRCSHVGVCLPEHRQRSPARRIGVADPTGRVLHLASAGSRASLRRGQIVVRAGEKEVTVPLAQTAGLVVHGNADVSAALLREVLERGYPIVWCAWSGRVVGWASPAGGPNGEARGLQHRLPDTVRLEAARAMVGAKIVNQAALLRRHGTAQGGELRALAVSAAQAPSRERLSGSRGGRLRSTSVSFRRHQAGMGADHAFGWRVQRPTTSTLP